jgi:uncharacterized protein (TIGR02001 family)
MRVLALAGLSISLIAPAVAEIESEFHVGYSSDYIFRGSNNTANGANDLYEFGLDFGGSGTAPVLGDVDWSAGLWYGSFGTNELDVYGEVSKSLSDTLSVAVGITNYAYFGGGAAADDIEPYISLGTSLGGISLGVGAYFNEDGDNPHDIYWELTAGYDMELSGNMTLGLSAVLGHFDEDVNGVDTYYGLSAALSIAASDSITVTPHITHIIDTSTGDETVGGVSVGIGF